MEIAFNIFLILHVFSGITGLVSGTLNLFRKKGDYMHTIIGKVFVYSMIITSFSAIFLSIVRANYFLFMVGIFTLYMISSGNRYIYLKLLSTNQKPKNLDWVITISMLLSGLLFVGAGVYSLTKTNYFGIVLITFGFLGLLFVSEDLKNYKGASKVKNYWLIAHIRRMSGAYIASFTAFLVVNIEFLPIQLPSILAWLLPTVVIVPFIIKWSRKYEMKKL